MQNSGVGMRKVPNDPAGENFYHKTIKDLFAIKCYVHLLTNMVFNLLSLFAMNKKHLLLFVFSYISFACNTHAESYAHDTLVNVLRNEVQFYFDKLKNKETPAYFISLRVVDNKRLFLSSDFGLSSMDENHTRILTPQVRVGSPVLDNFAYLAQNRPSSVYIRTSVNKLTFGLRCHTGHQRSGLERDIGTLRNSRENLPTNEGKPKDKRHGTGFRADICPGGCGNLLRKTIL